MEISFDLIWWIWIHPIVFRKLYMLMNCLTFPLLHFPFLSFVFFCLFSGNFFLRHRGSFERISAGHLGLHFVSIFGLRNVCSTWIWRSPSWCPCVFAWVELENVFSRMNLCGMKLLGVICFHPLLCFCFFETFYFDHFAKSFFVFYIGFKFHSLVLFFPFLCLVSSVKVFVTWTPCENVRIWCRAVFRLGCFSVFIWGPKIFLFFSSFNFFVFENACLFRMFCLIFWIERRRFCFWWVELCRTKLLLFIIFLPMRCSAHDSGDQSTFLTFLCYVFVWIVFVFRVTSFVAVEKGMFVCFVFIVLNALLFFFTDQFSFFFLQFDFSSPPFFSLMASSRKEGEVVALYSLWNISRSESFARQVFRYASLVRIRIRKKLYDPKFNQNQTRGGPKSEVFDSPKFADRPKQWFYETLKDHILRVSGSKRTDRRVTLVSQIVNAIHRRVRQVARLNRNWEQCGEVKFLRSIHHACFGPLVDIPNPESKTFWKVTLKRSDLWLKEFDRHFESAFPGENAPSTIPVSGCYLLPGSYERSEELKGEIGNSQEFSEPEFEELFSVDACEEGMFSFLFSLKLCFFFSFCFSYCIFR